MKLPCEILQTSKRSKNLCPPNTRLGMPSFCRALSIVRESALNRTKRTHSQTLESLLSDEAVAYVKQRNRPNQGHLPYVQQYVWFRQPRMTLPFVLKGSIVGRGLDPLGEMCGEISEYEFYLELCALVALQMCFQQTSSPWATIAKLALRIEAVER